MKNTPMPKIEVYDMTGRSNPDLSKKVTWKFEPEIFKAAQSTKINDSIIEFSYNNQTSRLDFDRKQITMFVNSKGIDRIIVDLDEFEINKIKQIITNE